MRILINILLASLALHLPLHATSAFAGPEYTGTVNYVYDASTIRVKYAKGGQIHVKLAGIKAPYAAHAKAALAERVLGKEVHVTGLRWKDGYLIGEVLLEGKGICGDLIREGKAKLSDEYSDSPKLREFEDDARNNRRGIWNREPVASG